MPTVFSMHHSPNHPLVVAPLVWWRAKWLSDKREAVCDLGSLGKFSPVSLELAFGVINKFTNSNSSPLSTAHTPLHPKHVHDGLPHFLQSSSVAIGEAAQRPGSSNLRFGHQCLGQAHGPCCCCSFDSAGARSQDHRLRWHEGGCLRYGLWATRRRCITDNYIIERADWPPAKLQVYPTSP
jgi:hypothetical protein